MLFNSYFFIFVFLPATLTVFFALGRGREQRAAIAWLVAASLFFYGWWNPAYLGLIIASILFNFTIGAVVGGQRRLGVKKSALTFGIAANLSVLAYYKYAGFFLANLNAALGSVYSVGEIILPLGISFFTFTQIAFLVDAYRGEAREYKFLHYALFVTYFPHLIAGPVLHHKEIMPQFGHSSIYRFDALNFSAGLTYFVLGLFKKAVIADSIAGFATPVFAAAATGAPLSMLDAWGGALAYTFQLYFDFSGYSDMAIGLALMMGVRLPLNFDSPYKAVNIIDFWRRWHMTLSRFLRDYLYIPLGGSRYGNGRRYANLMATMLLGGLWHGAGWTFIAWGALHGGYLVINHAWHYVRRKLGHDLKRSTWWGRGLAILVTFLAVVIGWVFFRANSFSTSEHMLRAMFTSPLSGATQFYADIIQASQLAKWLGLLGVKPAPELLLATALSVLMAITFFMPNTQQIMGRYYWAPHKSAETAPPGVTGHWEPRRIWALGIAVAGVWALLGLTEVSEFLYFQF